MSNFFKFILGSILTGILGLFLVNAKTLPVQMDLGARATAELVGQGQNWAKLTVEGRDVKIEGFAPSDDAKAKTVSIVDGVKGIYRVVDNAQKIAEQKAAIAPEIVIVEKPKLPEVQAQTIVVAPSIVVYPENVPPIAMLPIASKIETPVAEPITPMSALVMTPEKQACQVKLNKMLKSNSILFTIASDKIKTISVPFLSSLVNELKNCAYDGLIVTGHTDSMGQTDRNLALSELRAKSVAYFLVAGGVAATKISAIGKGEAEPLALNDTPEGRALNRRIEITVK